MNAFQLVLVNEVGEHVLRYMVILYTYIPRITQNYLIYRDGQSRMTRSSWTLVELCENLFADHPGNLNVVFLEEQEVRVALDTDIRKFDPLIVGDAHLLEVLNEAVVVCDMRAGLARDHDVRYLVELGELVDGASL